MSSQKTTNYDLNQWLPDDSVLRTDFNADNAKIDAALQALENTVAGQAAVLSSLHNGRVFITSYQGNGTYGSGNPVSVSLPVIPEVMLVTGGEHLMIYVKGSGSALVWYSGGGTGNVTVSWSGSQLSWYGSGGDQQMNSNGHTFYVVAFCKMT